MEAKKQQTAVSTSKNPYESVYFQEKVVQALLFDKIWAANFMEVFDVDQCLQFNHLKLIAKKFIDYRKKYKEFPTTTLLMDVIKQDLGDALASDVVLKGQVVSFLKKVITNEGLQDLPWVKEQATQFCKNQVFFNALQQCINLAGTENYDKSVDIVKKAITAGTQTTPGHVYFDDFEARYSANARITVATGIPQLDDKRILNGGLGNGEVGIVVAPTGVGKSHLLVGFAAAAVASGKNAFYYSLELSETLVGLRFDSNLTDIPTLELFDHRDVVKQRLEAAKDTMGNLVIKEFPSRTINVNTLRAHVEKLTYEGIKPDLLVIDYAGILRSTERYELPRLEMAMVIQELRGLARELQIPIWTALQSNKEGAKSEFIDVTNSAESYGQAGEADFVLGLQRPSAQKSTGYGNIFIAKNRAGVDGIKYGIHLDTGRSKLRVLTEDEERAMEASQAETAQREVARSLNMKSIRSFKDELRRNQELFEQSYER